MAKRKATAGNGRKGGGEGGRTRQDRYRESMPWVNVQVLVPPGKEPIIKGLAENMRDDYKREVEARAARGSTRPPA